MTTASSFDDDLARLDALGTAQAIRDGELTAAEVVEAAIARAEKLDGELGAIATPDYDRARRLAPRRTGPFGGVPTFVKDMTDVAGIPTRNGSQAFATAAPATKTSPIAQQLFDLGMVALGKSSLPEFGFTPSTEFPEDEPTRNPWNLDRTPGGSSGGAGALVASGVVPIAHGQDGGGSVRIPAACNGLVGLKPTRGRLLTDPHAKLLPLNIVTDGVLTRTVRDTAAYYVEAERLHPPRRLPPLGDVSQPLVRRLRIGALIDSPSGVAADEPTRRAFDETVALLEGLGHEVRPVDPPVGEEFAEDFIHYWSMMAWAVTYGGKVLFDKSFDRDRLLPVTHGLSDRFKANLRRTPGSIVRLRRSAQRTAEQFAELDVVLSPTLSHLPPSLGHLGTHHEFHVLFPRVEEWVGYTPLANATGDPAISLPLGHDEETNLPIGMMLSAPRGADGLLLRLALELEGAQPFRSLADA